jgi:hypothetical protein
MRSSTKAAVSLEKFKNIDQVKEALPQLEKELRALTEGLGLLLSKTP